MGSLSDQERSLEFLKGVFCGLYTILDRYLRDDIDSYREARMVIDRIKDVRSIIFTSKKQYDEDESFITKLEIKNFEAGDEMFNLYSKKEKNKYDKSKMERYRDVILSKPDDLEKLLNEDAVSKYTKKYFEISENDNNMEIQDYLFYHDLSKEEKDMTDEESVIKSTIDTLFGDLEYNLERFYFEVSLYCFFQTDFDFIDITDKIVQISIFQNKIEELISVYFNEDSSLLIYKSINEINDKIYKEKLESLYKDPNITFTSEDESKYNRYKDFILVSHSNISLYSLLKEDAYTDAAKKYFDIKEE